MAVSLNAFAAEDWKGRVIDEKGEPVAFANVAILSKTDSTLVAGTTTLEDGSLVVRLEGKDLLGLADNNVYCDYGSYIMEQTNQMDTKRLTFSVRYRFNSAQSKYKGTGAGKDAVSRIKK